jgi:hypothetical protein
MVLDYTMARQMLDFAKREIRAGRCRDAFSAMLQANGLIESGVAHERSAGRRYRLSARQRRLFTKARPADLDHDLNRLLDDLFDSGCLKFKGE